MSRVDRVLPSSRRPVEGSEESRREVNNKRARSVAAIEQELDETTQRLAANVDELVERLHPANLAKVGMASARSKLMEPSGAPRLEVVGAVVGAVVVGVVLWRVTRR